MSRGHSCVFGMKTQCMRTKSSTAGSDREENDRKRGGKKGKKGEIQKLSKVQSRLYLQNLQYSTVILYLVHWDVCLFSWTPESARESSLVFLKSQCTCRKQENTQLVFFQATGDLKTQRQLLNVYLMLPRVEVRGLFSNTNTGCSCSFKRTVLASTSQKE